MSLLKRLPSRVTPGSLAGEYLISSGVLFSPRRVTPAYLVQSCHSWNSAESCHYWNCCRRISNFQRRIAVAQSCHSWSSCPCKSHPRLLCSHVTCTVAAQSRPSWSSCPVMSLLVLLPCCVTPGVLAGDFLISSSVLLSPTSIIPGSLAQSCLSWCFCSGISLLDHLPSHVTPGDVAQPCQSWSSYPVMSLLEHLPANF